MSDVFGNPVPGITAGATAAGSVAAAATGEVLLGGLTSSGNFGTGTAGTNTITLIAGKAGTGKVAFAPSGGVTNLAAAWQTGYVPPVGAPAPVTSAEVAVTITQDVTKSITIAGTRATVKGKSGVVIEGLTTGIEDGKTVIPYFRFPGQTSYSQGSARPVVQDDAFSWQRKTGKKFYAYVTNDDGTVKSNRVIIPAK